MITIRVIFFLFALFVAATSHSSDEYVEVFRSKRIFKYSKTTVLNLEFDSALYKETKIVIENGAYNLLPTNPKKCRWICKFLRKFRVSKAEIAINGTLVVSKKELNRKVSRLEKNINLGPENSISLKLKGKPYSFLRFKILAKENTNNNVPPSLAISSPQDSTFSSNSSQRIVINYNDPDNNLDLSTFKATLDGQDVTSRFSVGTTEASADIELAEGSFQLEAKVSDQFGELASSTTSFGVDQSPPVLESNLEAYISTNENLIDLNITYEDILSGVDINSLIVLQNGIDVTSQFIVLASGAQGVLNFEQDALHEVMIVIKDLVGNRTELNHQINIDSIAPTLVSFQPEPETLVVTKDGVITVSGEFDEPLQKLKLNGQEISIFELDSFQETYTFEDGIQSFVLEATDVLGNSSTTTRVFTVKIEKPEPDFPTLSLLNLGDEQIVTENEFLIKGSSDLQLSSLSLNGEKIVLNPNKLDFEILYKFPISADYLLKFEALAEKGSAGTLEVKVVAKLSSDPVEVIPEDPSISAPQLATRTISSFSEKYSFLVSGTDPLQKNVDITTLEDDRSSALNGFIFDEQGDPLVGVRVSIAGRPNLGFTYTRDDGRWDMVTNGGDRQVVEFSKPGHLNAYRSTVVEWNRFNIIENVTLVKLDPVVQNVNFDQPVPQIKTFSQVKDQRGERRAALVIPEGTSANLRLANGTTKKVSNLNLRVTEYTVGENGPSKMPGTLPPTTAYTYAVEISADEAIAEGAIDIEFDSPVYYYVDNFLGFPTGAVVPTGYYSKSENRWVASENGRVISVINEENGNFGLDITGDGVANSQEDLSGIGITQNELSLLSAKYESGQSFWRSPMKHFTPWDLNMARVPSEDLKLGPLYTNTDNLNTVQPNTCAIPGSIIDVQNQVIKEIVNLPGSDHALVYSSSRSPGRKVGRSLNIPVTANELPVSLKGIELTIEVEGQVHKSNVELTPNVSSSFVWDGKDVFGRTVPGPTKAVVTTSYTYEMDYLITFEDIFSQFGKIPVSGDVQVFRPNNPSEYVLVSKQYYDLDGNITPNTMNSWGINNYHHYDGKTGVLNMGDGQIIKDVDLAVRTVAGNGSFGVPNYGTEGKFSPILQVDEIVVNSKNELYVFTGFFIYKVDTDYKVQEFFRNGQRLVLPKGLTDFALRAVDKEENLYFSAERTVTRGTKNVIWKVSPDNSQSIIAGNGWTAFKDGIKATDALFQTGIVDLEVAEDGTVFFADSQKVMVLTTDGLLYTLSGGGNNTLRPGGSTIPGIEVSYSKISDISLRDSGELLVVDDRTHLIEIDVSGQATHVISVADTPGGINDTGKTDIYMRSITNIGTDTEGGVVLSDYYGNSIQYLDRSGNIRVLVGTGKIGFTPDGSHPLKTKVWNVGNAVFGQKGELFYEDSASKRIRMISPDALKFNDEYRIPASNGNEIYIFDLGGFHQKTINSISGETIYEFIHNEDNELVSIKEKDGITTIERDSNGDLLSIIAKNGMTSTISLDSDRNISEISLPDGNSFSISYHPEDLIASFTKPNGAESVFDFDSLGKLVKDTNALEGFSQLEDISSISEKTIKLSSAEGIEKVFTLSSSKEEGMTQINEVLPGRSNEARFLLEGIIKNKSIDGVETISEYSADPRLGGSAKYLSSYTKSYPSGLVYESEQSKAVELTDEKDILSVSKISVLSTINSKTSSNEFFPVTGVSISTSAMGRVVNSKLDDMQRPIEISENGIDPVVIGRDLSGKITSLKQGNRETVFSFNSLNQLENERDPLGHIKSYEYNANGNVTKVIYPSGRIVEYIRDENQNIVGLINPKSLSYSLVPNILDNMTGFLSQKIGSAAPNSISYAYDLDQNISSITNAGGSVINYHRDEVGRVERITSSGGLQTTYNYNSTTGNLALSTSSYGISNSYSFDGDLPKSQTMAGEIVGTVEYGYNSDLQIISEKVNGDDKVFSYDNDNLLTGAGSETLTYSPTNRQLDFSKIGIVQTDFGYDRYGQDNGVDVKANGNLLFSTQITRYLDGRISKLTETVQGIVTEKEYFYDVDRQLIEVKENGVTKEEYSFDLNGNRETVSLGGITETSVYDNEDRIVSRGPASYTFDNDGELEGVSDLSSSKSFVFDDFGNLEEANINGVVVTYLMDSENRRSVRTKDGEVTEKYLYRNSLSPAAVLDKNNNTVSRFVYTTKSNIPSYMIKGGIEYKIISDHLGSVRLVVNASNGNIVQRMDYDTWGKVLSDTNPGFQPFGFAGGIYDQDTKLTKFGARDYDAETGRWISKDPIKFDGGINLYAYADNDPVNKIDSNGRNPIVAVGAVAAVGGIANFFGTLIGGGSVTQAIEAGVVGAAAGASAAIVAIGAGGGAIAAGFGVLFDTAINLLFLPSIYDSATLRDAGDGISEIESHLQSGGGSCGP